MEIKITVEDEMIRAIGSGHFTLPTAKSTFLELLQAVKQNRCSKVLFDNRAVTGAPTTMERYQYGQFCASGVNSLRTSEGLLPQFVYLMNQPLLDYGRFGETVAINRGMEVKATDSVEEARQWLGIPHLLI